jgi:DeoR family transcriptional regulator of aga operon
MNTIDRHQIIISKIKQEGRVNSVTLCEELKVSSVTIRKDLKLLEEKGFLFRTHGGATLQNPYIIDRPVDEKEKLHLAEKMRIGVAAAKLLQPNDSILIASGTTVQASGKKHSAQGKLNGDHISPQCRVGIDPPSRDRESCSWAACSGKALPPLPGPMPNISLGDFSCSKLFLGVDGIDLEFGLTTANVMEAHLNREMIKVSQKTIVLADSTKFGRRGFGRDLPVRRYRRDHHG